jgi:mono/diheme cytochrome c family protein
MALAACKVDASGGSTDGRNLFATQCASCHGADGRPNEMMVTKIGVKDLTAPELRAKLTPEYVEQQLLRGSKNFKMPSFDGQITREQIKVLADYVASSAFVSPPP